MTLRGIAIQGCDDVTNLNIELDGTEFEAVKRLAIASHAASATQCQPTISVSSEPLIFDEDGDLA